MRDDEEEVVGSTLSGMGTGAAMGSVIAPGIGTALGAVGGGLIGGIGGIFSSKRKSKQKQAMAQARKQMQELQRRQYAQRMADLENAMGYFQPVNAKLRDLYGDDAAVDFTPPKRMY